MPKPLAQVMTTVSPLGVMEDTGERMVPETSATTTFWEHIYRYRFATRFVRHQRVLDIACGEGYGAAALLRAGAASVIGIDIAEETCEHARRKYGVDARPGGADNIPLPARSVDVIVSFETIEHIERPAAFLDECRRVLTPGGTLVISTPNKEAFQELGTQNPFHCSELTKEQFLAILTPRFPRWELYAQRLKTAAWWSTRSLAVEASPWLRGRGFWRLRRALAPWAPEYCAAVGEKYRERPVEAILRRDSRLTAPLNPYRVRHYSSFGREFPLYYLAVARQI